MLMMTTLLVAAPLVGFTIWPNVLELVPHEIWKLLAVLLVSSFVPILAFSFYFYRRNRRRIEVRRIALKLKADEDEYVRMFENVNSGPYLAVAVTLTWLISLSGLLILFFGTAFWPAPAVVTAVETGQRPADVFPRDGTRLVYGMAHLGAYLWGLQYVFRRYVLNDLIPGTFFRLSIRMIVAAILAMVLFNAYELFAASGADQAEQVAIGNTIWPALAFFLGAFPQRALNWMLERNPLVAEAPDPTVRQLPLKMIEGMDSYDQLRLEEIGIEDSYDLANHDLVPLVLKTSYPARMLADWILQAKLLVHCGNAVGSLRLQGIRGIHDLLALSEGELEDLSKETGATLMSLKRARATAAANGDIRMLQHVSGVLGRFTGLDMPVEDPPDGGERQQQDVLA